MKPRLVLFAALAAVGLCAVAAQSLNPIGERWILAGQAPKHYEIGWLQTTVGNAIHFIDLADVVYFCAETKYTKVVTKALEAHIRTPLKELADNLEAAGFWQIHRSFVVAVKHIASVSRDDDGALWLSLRGHDARLPVSQRFQFRFKGM
jgi:DNA-binding LytR/AlgR family response regulator